jgi:iron complex outermembrane recepter protein
MKQRNLLTIFAFIIVTLSATFAQSIKVTGIVRGNDGNTITGANVLVKGASNNSTRTGFDGAFTINTVGSATLVFSYVGYKTKEIELNNRTNIEVSLDSNENKLDNVVVVGTRNPRRVATESTAPIDIINMKDIATQGAQTSIGQIMNMVAPSFTSNPATVSDGTDHLDPAMLRGLGPDQVLVLVNGKRRHTSALVNVNGSPGRGSVGTDLNAIPSFALEKIEVLRDGAAAQYGSDAIAGVINLGLKKNTDRKLNVALMGGTNLSKNANDHRGGNDGNNYQADFNYGTTITKEKGYVNATASMQFRDNTARSKDFAGNLYNAYNAVEERARRNGLEYNDLFNNINEITPANQTVLFNSIKSIASGIDYFTTAQKTAIAGANDIATMRTALGFDATEGELNFRNKKRSDYNLRVGQSSLQSMQFFLNSAYPISENVEAYLFGGTGYRTGTAAGFYRRPNESRTYSEVYPDGFLPLIDTEIRDLSASGGFRGKFSEGFTFDISNTFGKNNFDYKVDNSINNTLRGNSPTEFDAGGLQFYQNTTNLDLSKKVDVLAGLNIAFGGEYRLEGYKINTGEPDSYNYYDVSGNVFVPTGNTAVDNANRVTDFFGNNRPGGAQVFPGFSPQNAANEKRNSYAGYADLELDITKRWLLSGAVRYEDYSDFGNTTNFKVASRFKVTNNVNIRAAASTGFRAPSLHQQFFSSTATITVGGIPNQVVTFRNDSEVAKLYGIPQLKQEESKSLSAGFTAKIPAANLTITADAYIIKIDDRVTLSDQFSRPGGTPAPGTTDFILNQAYDNANAARAVFFSNAIDTESKGVDVVITHKANLGKNATLRNEFSGTISQTKQIGDIQGSETLKANGQINNYFSEQSKIYLEQAVPRKKANLSNTLNVGKFEFFVRNVYFGEVTDPNTTDVNKDGFVGAYVLNGRAVENEHKVFEAKVTTDISLGFNFSKNVKFVVGANNIFDIYPEENVGKISARRPSSVNSDGTIAYANAPVDIDVSTNQQFVYSRNVSQFGFNGRFVFARLAFSLF